MSDPYSRLGNPEDVISALAMPLEGHSQDEIVEALRRHDVQDMSLLTPQVVSVRAPRRVLQDLESIARVEFKTPRSMHFR